jgi:hypothetical protein
LSKFAGGNSSSVAASNDSTVVGSTGYLSSSRPSSSRQQIDLTAYPIVNATAASESSAYSAFRVLYDPDVDAYTPYVALRCFITTVGGSRYFVGVFDTNTGDIAPIIQIPLIGQTIDALVEKLSNIPGISVQVLHNWGFNSVSELLDSVHINTTGVWGYFFVDNSATGNSRDNSLVELIQFYYTSVEPGIEQNSPSQSIGGYVSPSTLYPHTTLESPVSFYEQYLKVVDDELSSFSLLQINDEVMEVDRWDGLTAYIKTRQSFGTPIRYHPKGSVVRGLINNEIFDGKLNKEKRQYRCIAIKNASENGDIARDVIVYFKLASRNNFSATRLAIEIPKSQYHQSSASSGNRSFLRDTQIANQYEDGYFVDCYLTMESGDNSGQSRLVTGYTGSTGEYVFESDLPYMINQNDVYSVGVAPSQRVKSGFEMPLTGSDALAAGRVVSEFQSASFFRNGLNINFNETRTNGGDLHPNEVIYVWIEREIDDINEAFSNNRAVLAINYNKV